MYEHIGEKIALDFERQLIMWINEASDAPTLPIKAISLKWLFTFHSVKRMKIIKLDVQKNSFQEIGEGLYALFWSYADLRILVNKTSMIVASRLIPDSDGERIVFIDDETGCYAVGLFDRGTYDRLKKEISRLVYVSEVEKRFSQN